MKRIKGIVAATLLTATVAATTSCAEDIDVSQYITADQVKQVIADETAIIEKYDSRECGGYSWEYKDNTYYIDLGNGKHYEINDYYVRYLAGSGDYIEIRVHKNFTEMVIYRF